MGDNMENKKLTALEKQWILYDVGNSAFILLVATIMPIYFNSLCQSAGIAEVDYLAYWGYAASDFHADRGAERAGAGHAGRLSGPQEENISRCA